MCCIAQSIRLDLPLESGVVIQEGRPPRPRLVPRSTTYSLFHYPSTVRTASGVICKSLMVFRLQEMAALCRELLALGISKGLPNQPHRVISCFLSSLSSMTPRPSRRMSAGAPKTCPSSLVKVTSTPVKSGQEGQCRSESTLIS